MCQNIFSNFFLFDLLFKGPGPSYYLIGGGGGGAGAVPLSVPTPLIHGIYIMSVHVILVFAVLENESLLLSDHRWSRTTKCYHYSHILCIV